MSELIVGDVVLDFDLESDGGGCVFLNVFKGSLVVVYFYFKDNILGCIKEVIVFIEQIEDFWGFDVIVIGILFDLVKKYDNFVVKYSFVVCFGVDMDMKMVEVYGVWVEKFMYGKKYMGVERVIFLVDVDGKIVQIWCKVKVFGYVEVVLDVVCGF